MKKLLFFVCIGAVFAMAACNGTPSAEPATYDAEKEMLPGQMVFAQYCKLCHGTKGDLGLSGAANLTLSVLNKEEITYVVINGRKAMPAWGHQLSPDQINQVAEYVLTLRQ